MCAWLGRVFAAGVIFALAAPTWASVQINFSDDTLNPAPGFRIDDNNGSGISELIELGSNESLNTDGLDFQRITNATSGTGGADVLNYIVVMPELEIVADNGDSVIFGTTFSFFGIAFADGGTTLSTPLMIADMHLANDFVAVGSSGVFEAEITMNLTNVRLDAGVTESTLLDFKLNADAAELIGDPLNGPDFNFVVSSSGSNIAEMIRAGMPPVIGSAAGSIFATPEPASITLLAAGLFAVARRRRSHS
jgi:hypothetical protein